jgi:hypothetical protein
MVGEKAIILIIKHINFRAFEYFYTQYTQIKKDWTNILFSISQGDVTKYNELMRMNVFSFWNFCLYNLALQRDVSLRLHG